MNIPVLKSVEEWRESLLIGNWHLREQHTKEESWFILTEEVADILGTFIKGSRVVEVFAGTGFLAHHLRKRSGLSQKEYRAYDNRSTHDFSTRYPGVVNKNAFMAPIKSADTVIMTWPPYDTNHAARIVKKMRKGQCLVFNGEGYGGCTGDDEFFDVLGEKFIELKHLTEALDGQHVRFKGINDDWTIYEKVSD